MLETPLAVQFMLGFREMHARISQHSDRPFMEDEALLYHQTCRTLTANARMLELRIKRMAAQYERESQGEAEEASPES